MLITEKNYLFIKKKYQYIVLIIFNNTLYSFMSWTEEKVTKLKELWGKGNTASEIANIIGGISRNAVIGKAHRLNLSAKIKTRTATSNQDFETSVEDKKNISKRGKKINLDH